jgi:hypothetical protein
LRRILAGCLAIVSQYYTLSGDQANGDPAGGPCFVWREVSEMVYSLSDLARSGLTVSGHIRPLENKICTSSGRHLNKDLLLKFQLTLNRHH